MSSELKSTLDENKTNSKISHIGSRLYNIIYFILYISTYTYVLFHRAVDGNYY